jgi:peptidoglycan hydrolase-like protein with peptidoglycan-binding domain
MPSRTTRSLVAIAASFLVVLGAAACGKDDKADSTTTTAKATTTTEATTTTAGAAAAAATVRFDKGIQSQLAAVGCYRGTVDGIVGPETDAALVAFQRDSGLIVTGEFGAETQSVLDRDVAAKKTVCVATTTTTGPGSTTTTTAGANSAPCTAVAIVGGLGGDPSTKLTGYVCSGGYAAGTVGGGTKFVLKAQNGKWTALSQDPCGSASAGLPPVILQDGC